MPEVVKVAEEPERVWSDPVLEYLGEAADAETGGVSYADGGLTTMS